MTDSDYRSGDCGLSIFSAARLWPERLCIRTSERDWSFAQVSELVREDITRITHPALGRPYVLRGHSDLATMVKIYALLEMKIPMLLLSPKLTQPEVDKYLALVEGIEEPLPEDAAAILFTSGTTGTGKPAVLTRRSLIANAKAVAEHIHMHADDVWQLAISPARVGGLGIITRSLFVGSAVALAPRYSAQAYVEQLQRDAITIASVVPTMLSDMMQSYPNWRPKAPFRLMLVGGARCAPSLREKAALAGIPVVTTYAMTEAASTVAMSSYEERMRSDAVGHFALPGVGIRLQQNRIFVHGDMLMHGYWGRQSLDRDTWFDTEDRGKRLEDGGIEILGRASDVIVSGGEKVYPDEVQKALESVPGVAQAYVCGLADEKWGAIVTALLVADDKPVAVAEIVRGITTKLARYKCPRRLAWVKEIARTKEGKYAVSNECLRTLDLQIVHYTEAN